MVTGCRNSLGYVTAVATGEEGDIYEDTTGTFEKGRSQPAHSIARSVSSLDDSLSFTLSPVSQSALSSRLASVYFAAVRSWEIRQTLPAGTDYEEPDSSHPRDEPIETLASSLSSRPRRVLFFSSLIYLIPWLSHASPAFPSPPGSCSPLRPGCARKVQ